MDLREIFSDIQTERERQEFQWGKDAHMNPYDWHSLIEDYNGMARRKALQRDPYKARERYIQVAALAIAAIQQLERDRDRITLKG